MALLEVRNIKKTFGSNKVLRDVSFSLEEGQVLAIIGSSGSGKTTLLRCLNFLETPDSGEIFVQGKQLLSQSEEEIRQNRLHFGLVFQNFNLFPQYTVFQKCHPGTYSAEYRQAGCHQRKSPSADCPCGSEPKGKQLSPSALRRSAAACGHCKSAGYEPSGTLL